MKTCPQCNTSNRLDAKFCVSCRFNFAAAAAPAPVAPPAPGRIPVEGMHRLWCSQRLVRGVLYSLRRGTPASCGACSHRPARAFLGDPSPGASGARGAGSGRPASRRGIGPSRATTNPSSATTGPTTSACRSRKLTVPASAILATYRSSGGPCVSIVRHRGALLPELWRSFGADSRRPIDAQSQRNASGVLTLTPNGEPVFPIDSASGMMRSWCSLA